MAFRGSSLALATVLATASVARIAIAQATPAASKTSVNIPFEKLVLPNGLTVLLSEDHTTPTVAVDIFYHVGSKNEVVGHTGFAHMFEHVMFTGSGHVPYGTHDRFTEGVGGNNNGSTGFDVTQYYETVPSNYLETILWLESDRMGFLLDSLDDAKFKAQRDIVQNERRQSADNVPNGRNFEVIGMTMYPKGHPYSWPPIGSMADLKAATVEDVKNFFRLYYAPNNATLAIVGDIDPKAARALVTKYFADLPRGKQITRPVVGPSALAGEKRITLEDRVQIPRLTVAWPSADAGSADQPPLDLLSDILGNTRTAWINKALIYDKQLAASANVFQSPNESAGIFLILLTPRPGHTLQELETEADSVIARIKRDGPSEDDLKRVKASQQASFIDGLQSNLGKAVQLDESQTYFNDPSFSFRVQYARAQAVTAADIKRVANKYLTAKRVVLSTVPMGKTDLASHADKSTVVTDPLTEKAEVKP
ncbi:MAG TPA: pitrilysin family protein [Gemmatimonadaceae bacterium]|jgi:zinc protease